MTEGEEKTPISRPGALYCGQVSFIILGGALILKLESFNKKNFLCKDILKYVGNRARQQSANFLDGFG